MTVPLTFLNLTLILLIISSSSLLHFTTAQNSPRDFVDAHNRARAAVGVGPIRWDQRVAAYARNYGNKIKANCKFEHSGGPYGENLAFAKPDLTGRKSVQMWVGEKKFYDCRGNRCTGGGECRHFTQVVWKDSTKLGCARVVCNRNKGTIVICSYDPPGNFQGRRPYTCRRNSLAEHFDEYIDQYV